MPRRMTRERAMYAALANVVRLAPLFAHYHPLTREAVMHDPRALAKIEDALAVARDRVRDFRLMPLMHRDDLHEYTDDYIPTHRDDGASESRAALDTI